MLPTWLLLPPLQVTNPLYLWQLWRADARYARHCFARHNAMMDDKVAALLKLPPPDYTIAGTWHPDSHRSSLAGTAFDHTGHTQTRVCAAAAA